MKFSDLAFYFEKLEQTSSRLALIEILSDLYKKSDKDEIAQIVYLTQGRVAPFYAAVEIGMAEKSVASAIADAYDSTKDEVLALYRKLGDMGQVAQQLARDRVQNGAEVANENSLARDAKKNNSVSQDVKSASSRGENFISSPRFDYKKDFSVLDIFNILVEIAHTSGEGTVEKRQMLLSHLLRGMNPISAKHLARIPLSANRLGVGDPTVLDGLATAILGDKSNRKLLEKAYNETSDLGLIARTLLEKGLIGVEKLSVTVGRPIRSELCERLPNPEKVFSKMGDSIHASPKFDGFRVQIHKNGDEITMFSRNLENMTHMFPELILGTRKQVKAKTAILDTEALAYQPESEEYLPFQETTKRRRKYNIEEIAKTLPLRAFVFDLLYVDGKSLLDTPLLERMEILQKTLMGDEILVPAPGKVLYLPEELQLMLDDSISKGLEGVVVKKVDSLYQAGGRNFNWVKLKRHSSGELNDTIDCVILGYVVGRGKRTAFGAGALLAGIYDEQNDEFVTVCKIGTGLSDEEWRSIKERTKNLESVKKPARINSLITPSVWVEPQIVIEVLADEITRSPIHTAGRSVVSLQSLAVSSKSKDQRPATSDQIGYALRFPRLVNFRGGDKKAEDATTVKELIAMYNQQGKN